MSPQQQRLSLYHFPDCPFCRKVRDAMHRLGVEMRLRDVRSEPDAERELIEGGGERKVPCLRIEGEDGTVEWMYESDRIIRYLEQRFG